MYKRPAFPFRFGESFLERAHPHIVERLRLLWGYPEGGRYLAQLIVDTRGGRSGFAPEVMSELLTLATISANPGLQEEGRSAPFKVLVRRGNQGSATRMVRDTTLSLHPISYHSAD